MQATKTKRVFQLRKTGSARQPNQAQQSRITNQQQMQRQPSQYEGGANKQQISNDSVKLEQSKVQKVQQINLHGYPDLVVDQQELHFNSKIKNVQVRNIKVTNTGSSAIYYQWNFKNLPKINGNAIKDPKPNFYCHYQPNVVKPGQQAIFSFCFFSQTPGVFVQEVTLTCQPEPATKIFPIKLKGTAFIEDELKSKRENLQKDIKQKVTQIFTKQVLQDIVSQVKSPVPPLPDISNIQIAQRQFQSMNSNLRLYFNSQVHKWFSKLYQDICDNLQIPQETRHWDQSVAKLVQLIEKVKDPILRESFDKRLQNYKLLSSTKPPQKSDLFPKVRDILLNVGYLLGGAIADQAKKQLQMWQIPFQEPNEAQTQQQVAAKKDQRTKIIAEWAKKMKKKKWGPDQENQMLNNFRGKLQKGTSKALMQKLSGFDDQASFQGCRAQIKKNFDHQKYFGFLERLKTVDQYPIQGKKILLKYDLKLKQNPEQALAKLQQYLAKKKQEQLRLQQQKKNQQANKNKKKAPVAKKKKGQKQQQQIKVLSFDFNTLLDNQSWQGFTNTLKFIIQKQPLLLLIGISYGPKTGVFSEKFSLKFLLQQLKIIQPAIQYLDHKGLFELKSKIEQQTLNQGSIYLVQNMSFLPCEGMQAGQAKIIQKVQNGEQKKIQTIQSHKMLMSQVERQLQKIMPAIDIIVREDRFVNRVSGLSSYGKKENILGLAWWRYIAFALRTRNSSIVLGGEFTAEKIVLLSRIIKYAHKIYLVGEIGVKIWMASNNLQVLFNIKNSKNEQNFIKQFLQMQKNQSLLQKLIFPKDIVVASSSEQNLNKTRIQLAQNIQHEQNKKILDIGQSTCQQFQQLQSGSLVIIDSLSIVKSELASLQTISKILYKRKQQKKQRHLQQQSTPSGINYQKDLVVYFVGITEEQMEKIQLKDKKPKKVVEAEQEQEQQLEQEENQIKKIDQVTDFRISNVQFFQKLLSAQYSYGLKDVSKYPKSD